MATVTVTVIAPYQVSHEGTVFGPGETAEVSDWLAQRWQALGYVDVEKAEDDLLAKRKPPKKSSPLGASVPDSGG